MAQASVFVKYTDNIDLQITKLRTLYYSSVSLVPCIGNVFTALSLFTFPSNYHNHKNKILLLLFFYNYGGGDWNGRLHCILDNL